MLADGANVWEFKMKQYDDSIEKDKMMIQAGKEIAVSWAYWGAAPTSIGIGVGFTRKNNSFD
jgi:hypothetical protein